MGLIHSNTVVMAYYPDGREAFRSTIGRLRRNLPNYYMHENVDNVIDALTKTGKADIGMFKFKLIKPHKNEDSDKKRFQN